MAMADAVAAAAAAAAIIDCVSRDEFAHTHVCVWCVCV